MAPKTCEDCGITEGDVADHTGGDWTETVPATLIAAGREEILCTVCGEVLDTRESEIKDAGVDGAAFNFTPDEFVVWLNSVANLTVEEEPMDSVDLAENRVAYMVRTDNGNGALIMECDENGNVCLIRSYFGDDTTLSIAVAMVIASEIDSQFDVQSCTQVILIDRAYTEAGMVLAILDDGEVVLVPEQHLAEMSEASE